MSRRAAPATLALTGLGMRSSIGQNVVQGAAATRAGICRFAQWPPPPPTPEESDEEDADDEHGTELVAAAIKPDLGDCDWTEKLEALATQPLMEALWMAGRSDLVEDGAKTRWALYLATPAMNRPGVDQDGGAAFAEDVRERTLFGFDIPEVNVIAGGNAGVMVALQQAVTALTEGRVEVCVVGGVDSLLHTPFLEHLDQEGRLKTATTPGGLIPGEGAGFVVVERIGSGATAHAPALARFTPPRLAKESESPDGKKPGRGSAAAMVLRQTLAEAPCPPDRINRVITDLNGERWRFLEWALASNPALLGLPPDWRLWHPADCLGDVGAATGAVHLCLAARAFARDYAAGDGIIIFNASETGERAALCVHPAAPE